MEVRYSYSENTNIKLSVLVATLDERGTPYVDHLDIPNWCELIIDNSVGCLGDKRQKMLENAKGDYACVLDDDDNPTDDYFDLILEGIEKDVDAICVSMNYFKDGDFVGVYKQGFHNPHQGSYVADAGHFCPIKRELALLSGYRSCGMGEDFDHIAGLQKYLKTGHYIKRPVINKYHRSVKKEYSLYPDHSTLSPRIITGNLPMV